MRVWLAIALARLACRVLSGRDDRVVILNTKRHRVISGPRAGVVLPFITKRGGTAAVAFPPDEVPEHLGLSVPVIVVRLAGYDLEGIR